MKFTNKSTCYLQYILHFLYEFSSLHVSWPQVVKGQAIKILGSVDFLGNPVGLLSDVASGVSGMIAIQPDVVGLVRDVAHGTMDTTSKVTLLHVSCTSNTAC